MRRIFVKAKPGAKKANVEEVDDTHFVIAVRERPEQGKANRAVAKALAAYLDIAPSRIRLLSGPSTKQKVFEIM